jgi:general secretion pathway protein H
MEQPVQERGIRTRTVLDGRARSALGFTLLELLVVLTIAVGIAALVLPNLSNAIGLFELKSGARQMATALQAARGRAIAQDGEVAVIVDVEKRTYQVTGSGEVRPVSPELTLKLETADVEVLSDQVAAIRFFPDGSSTGGRLTLAASGQRYVISVDWLTGRVRIHE